MTLQDKCKREHLCVWCMYREHYLNPNNVIHVPEVDCDCGCSFH